ncbi:MAG: endonuclease MutS2 [Defluviitaleaceae bacterium]|nr:endonuclease MutS2 [Defluviitaleaceae bacterium]
MNPKALSTLEYPKIIEMLQARAISPMGKAQAANLTPMTDLADITRAQEETTAATGYILRKGSLPLGGIKDIRPFISRALAGGMLYIEDLLGVGDFLYVCGKAMTYGRQERNKEPTSLSPYFDGILTAPALEAEISRCIKGPTEIADSASPKLRDIRRSIGQAHEKVRTQLQSVIRSGAYKDMLQDAIITLRGDRFCVPVKADQRGNFPGMVHDQSSTGATVFMEPLAVVDINNKIRELHFEEKREEERILLKLSGQVAGEADILTASIENLTYLDFVFAKGELSLAQEASPPVFNQRGYVNIVKGRHPLLKPDIVVPTNIWLGGEFNMLLITGPNTGGKTVTLKTIGLLTCMGQSGLHIPAAEHSELAVFGDVFADIGDEQSIEQSLSTFSSHMSNIVGILGQLGGQALVLLDELGAGTDPTEGAALAIAILQHLQARGARTVITTHYSELKLYALSTPGVENASCEFDVETLRPTYRLLIGVPGKSNAFAIAARLGLPDSIINQAKDVLSSEDVRFEDVITDLEAGKKMVVIEQERAAVYRREAEALRQDLAKTQEKLQAQKDKILEKARQDAMYTVQQAKREAEALLKTMHQTKEVEEARQKMRETLSEMETTLAPAITQPTRKPPENLRRGDKVFIHSLNQHGTVSTPPNDKGEVHIQAGIMKIKVHIGDLSLGEEDVKDKFTPAGGKGRGDSPRVGKAMSISSEIDLRGMLPEEAMGVAGKYLDDAFLGGLAVCTLIHGKGTGAVRNAVHSILKKHPHVSEYRLGKYGEGETGVTVVTLK